MPKKNRSYKKGTPFRDARLFVIIAEGEREDTYFRWFNARNSRINIHIIERDENASAPKLFIGRLNKAQEEDKYSPQADDQVWFVCDVDRWRDQIEELRIDCEQVPNWNIAVSNPCFEIWLHLHSGDIQFPEDTTCGNLKTRLTQSLLGHYDPEIYCLQVDHATTRARNADNTPDSFFPDKMRTKLYKLAESMLTVLGNNWKEDEGNH